MLTTILAMRGTARAIVTRARAALTLGAPLSATVRGVAADARAYTRLTVQSAPAGPVDAAHGGGRGVRE